MTHLETGQNAPAFSGKDQSDKLIQSSDYKGKKHILFFYPKDNTPGCTAEACNLRDNYAELQKVGYEIIGISPDSVKKHANFANKFDLPFSLIADVDKKMLEDYGVWAEKSMFGRKYMGVVRTTFVVDESGKIAAVIKKVKTKDHAKQILDLMEEVES